MKTNQIGRCLSIALLLLSLSFSEPSDADASQPSSQRIFYLTLIPNFEDQHIYFDGHSLQFQPGDSANVTGLPLKVKEEWKDPYNTSLWNIRGRIQGGRVEFNADDSKYHLLIERFDLGPQDEVKLVFPFVNLDYSLIQPAPDPPDDADLESRQRTHRFTYRGGETGRKIERLDIPFTIIAKNIDLTLTPLVGETYLPEKHGFRLSGKVLFHSISDFDEFGWHCQNTANRILHGKDYRAEHLLYAIDSPHHFGPDVLSAVYGFKPTLIGLRSELVGCQYDQQQELGEVEAIFSGRSKAEDPDPSLFPSEWHVLDIPDRHDPFVPLERFRGVKGHVIKFGRIVLAPGDTLTITVPDVVIQVDRLSPVPDNLIHLDSDEAGQRTQVVYIGPALFDLSLPYVAQSGLYLKQFPAFLRPTIFLLEEELGEPILFTETWLTWIVLGMGLLLLVLSKIVSPATWLAIPAWVMMAIGFFYGVRGSFGLLCLAIVLYLSEVVLQSFASKKRQAVLWKTFISLVSFALVILTVHIDHEGNTFFQGLTEPDLSPFTPLILMMLIGALFVMLYERPQDAKVFTAADFPTLVLFLAVLALYDVFDKSLLALLILLMGVLYVSRRVLHTATASDKPENGNVFGENLQSRLSLVFGNRIVPVAIIVLIVFALVNDLSGTYANEMQLRISPLLTPILIPLLSFVSVFLAFGSIALLFVVVYPVLPSQSGYLKATFFAVFLFLVFLFGIGTDDRLIAALPNILIGRVIYYFSVPLLIGIYLDINEFMQNENQRMSSEGKEKERLSFRAASAMYLKNLQSIVGTLAGLISLLVPSIYAFSASQPVLVTYFDLLEKLVLLPV